MTEAVLQAPKVILKYQGSVLRECVLDKDVFTIGRRSDNDLVIDDAAVSGHHARIAKIQAVYFLEDLESTNGTLLNGQKVDRKQIRDADVVTLGKHRLVFLDEGRPAAAPLSQVSESSDKTMVIRSGEFGLPPQARRKVGVLRVLSGKVEHKEYCLTRQLSVIGSHADAVVKLTGFFAPKTAAMIGRRGDRYCLTVPERGKPVGVNDMLVDGECDLHDGDLIELAGVKMHFSLKEAR